MKLNYIRTWKMLYCLFSDYADCLQPLYFVIFFGPDHVKSPVFHLLAFSFLAILFRAVHVLAPLSTMKTTLVVISHNALSFLSIYWPEIKIRKFCTWHPGRQWRHRLKMGSHARHQESFVACLLYFGPSFVVGTSNN